MSEANDIYTQFIRLLTHVFSILFSFLAKNFSCPLMSLYILSSRWLMHLVLKAKETCYFLSWKAWRPSRFVVNCLYYTTGSSSFLSYSNLHTTFEFELYHLVPVVCLELMTSPFFQLSHKACYLFRIGSLLQNGVDLFLIVADCEGLLFFFMVALLM